MDQSKWMPKGSATAFSVLISYMLLQSPPRLRITHHMILNPYKRDYWKCLVFRKSFHWFIDLFVDMNMAFSFLTFLKFSCNQSSASFCFDHEFTSFSGALIRSLCILFFPPFYPPSVEVCAHKMQCTSSCWHCPIWGSKYYGDMFFNLLISSFSPPQIPFSSFFLPFLHSHLHFLSSVPHLSSCSPSKHKINSTMSV